jgi:isocitrate dehydrogenase
MAAVLEILSAAGAELDIETIEIGEQVYLRGTPSGIDDSAWESIRRTRVFLKAPITTPQGGGFKSLNVTTRVALGLYANIRPAISYHPFVQSKHPDMNLVVIRENEEDLYAGIEHRQTADVMQSLKLITRPGSERIIRFAFDYAQRNGRSKVTAFAKDNIMKLSDGLFHDVFDEVAADYPAIEAEYWIVDIGAAKLADTPETFDVVVLPNLYGDILSDVAAQIAGSVGMAGAANIGEGAAMFEAIHGSAPRRAGQNLANPSGLLNAAVLMLVHIGQPDIASTVQNAWMRTLEDGIHTYDVYDAERSNEKVGTREFGAAVVSRLGEQPTTLTPANFGAGDAESTPTPSVSSSVKPIKQTVGVDVFFDWNGGAPTDLADLIKPVNGDGLVLQMISNRGAQVWPKAIADGLLVDHWRARFTGHDVSAVSHAQIAALLRRIAEAGLDFIKTENLCTFDGNPGYSLALGE